MTLVSRISSGLRPEWLNKRRTARRAEPRWVMPAEAVHPDSGSSLYEQLMAAFWSLRSSGEEESADERERREAEEVEMSHNASRLALELSTLDREEKQRLLKNTGLSVKV
ncbi:MAG: hypothetical protein LBQ75_06090 [Zoogloeaceae bacterium]|jgi:hypothetical protein|nr:hypothetical protein [Zoogloeaceae bacterium]